MFRGMLVYWLDGEVQFSQVISYQQPIYTFSKANVIEWTGFKYTSTKKRFQV